MAKFIILAVLGLVATISASALEKTQLVSDVSEDQIRAFKGELENEVKNGNMTCENYKEGCVKSGNAEPNSVCQVMLQAYLCEKLQDYEGVREIIARIEKLHPTAINTKAGHEFDAQEQTEDEYYDEDDYDESDETAEPTAEPTAAPTAEPTAAPTAEPTAAPTAAPTAESSTEPPKA